ncbi:single-stranded DNA-binding protein [Candidatus Daviesbacteria bacterium]|nr:single-stranded DNA-binding protein [Candidatus Daviesbacteria bacterium]
MASRSWNRVELIGNLTRDPELRYTPSGTAVSTIGLATNRVYVSEGERKEEVDFHRIVAWGKLAELCNQLLKKGSRVFISGRLQYREWEGQDGQKRRDAEIVLEDMIQLTPRAGGYPSEEAAGEAAPSEVAVPGEKVGKPAAKSEPKEKEAAPEANPKEELSDAETDDLPF